MPQSKFAIVDFFQSNEVEIIDTKYLLTSENASTFNSDDWDPKTQVCVMWPIAAGKTKVRQEKHVARILRFHDDTKVLTGMLKLLENGGEIPFSGEVHYGRGKRSTQPKRLWTSDEDDNFSDQDEQTTSTYQRKKKQKASRRMENNKNRDALREIMLNDETQFVNTDEENDLKAELQKAKDTIAQLQKENSALRNSLRLIEGLPKLLEKVEQLSNQPQIVPNPVPAHSQPSQPKRMLSPQSPARVQYVGGQLLSPERASPKSSAQLKRTVFNYPVNENGEVDLGYGVCVGADNLQLISLTDIKKTTYTVCEVVFSRHELANSSLSGRPSNAFKDVAVKEKLNEQKVQAVLGVVRQLHPKAEEGAIRKAIGCKLNITQKIVKRSISTPSGSTSTPQ